MTRENPDCYHGALNYMSKLTGIPVKKIITTEDRNKLYGPPNKKGKRKLLFKSHNITVEDVKGIIHPFISNVRTIEERGIIPVRYFAETDRTWDEFGVEYKKVGKYNDSLGGGWYSNVDLYKINGNFFAMMECTCR